MKNNESIKVGDSFTLKKEITPEMVWSFANLSGDFNPIHMNEEYCIEHGLKSRVVHGMLILSLLSALLGMHFPGKGTLWLSQNIDFITPARIGDTIAITATAIKIEPSKVLKTDVFELKINITNQDNKLLARGRVKVCIK